MNRTAALVPVLVALLIPTGVVAQLGTIDFPNSGAAAAQPHFQRGVLLLHSFEYEDAAAAFREAQRVDPSFALAYWGEAMTYNHPIWMEQDTDAARAALARLAPTPEARQKKTGTAREREWLAAIDVLYGEGSKQERDFRYADAMRRMHDANPGDHEAATFYALALLGTTHEGRDFATYMRAAAIASPVFQANPDHPGAAHYLIHSFDDPIHAPLGLPAARAYSAIAPAAAHAQHMTSHIFVAMGMWEDVVRANERARDVQDARNAKLGRPANVCGHYTSWLQYGYLQQGRTTAAASMMDACHARVTSGKANAGEISYFADMRARQVLDTHDWASVGRWAADVPATSRARGTYDFLTAYAALQLGEAEKARAVAAKLEAAPAPHDAILGMQLRGLLLARDGKTDDAVALLHQAADAEAALPYEFGPPAIVKPSHELLGETLLAAGRAEAARDAFRVALSRTPLRADALEGARAAATRLGDTAAARELAEQLSAIRSHAHR